MKILFNIHSPDGFPISFEPFESESEANEFYKEWKKGFEKQGYYSSNNGRISIKELDNICLPPIKFNYHEQTANG